MNSFTNMSPDESPPLKFIAILFSTKIPPQKISAYLSWVLRCDDEINSNLNKCVKRVTQTESPRSHFVAIDTYLMDTGQI